MDDQEKIYWWFWLFFFLGAFGTAALAFGYKKRLPSVNFTLGIILTIMSGGAFAVAGTYYRENVLIGDICEQCFNILKFDEIPVHNEELGYYYSCMSSPVKTDLGTQKFEVMSRLNQTMEYYRDILTVPFF